MNDVSELTWGLARPWALLALVLPLLILAWWWWRRGRLRPALRFPAAAAFADLPPSWRVRTRWLPGVLGLLGLVALTIAWAGPRGGETIETIRSEGIDIMVALDTSGSMLAEDMVSNAGKRINRLRAAKEVTADFVGGRMADRIGLVSFDEIAVPRCPPTLDYGVLYDLLAEVEIDGEGGHTAIGMAIASAVNRLRRSDAESRVIILVTDGRNNAGRIEPADAAEMARLLDIKIYAIGIGSEGEAPYPIRGRFGVTGYQPVRSDIDEETLKVVAKQTGGAYFRASHRGQLDSIFAHIDELERSEIEVEKHVRHHELFPAFLRAGAVLLLLSVLGSLTTWRTWP
ncbi:MAG: VWA domain-containing protein [Acidobacteriota bacterium]